MKEKLTRNIGLKILSVVLAVIMWLIITNVDDPVETRRFTNMPVTILNEDVIASLDQVYDIDSGESISFTIEARRKIKDSLSRDDFLVTADFSEISLVNSVPIVISAPQYGDDVVVVEGRYQNMKVKLEESDEKTFKVDVILRGEAAEGYYIGEKSVSTLIRVSGPKSRVESISEVVVEVPVSGVNKSVEISAKPKALDDKGKEINSSKLTFSDDNVAVKIGVFQIKEINVQITTTGEPAFGYIMSKVEFEPKKIQVAGEPDLLKRISFLSITESITEAKEDINKEINLQDELMPGLILVGEDKTAIINITIEKLDTKEVSVWPADIDLRNKPEDLTLTFNVTWPITFNIMGRAEDIMNFTKSDLNTYIELADLTIGTYNLAIETGQSNKIKVLNKPMLNFDLAR